VVSVTASTQYSGAATSFSQVRNGLSADVHGQNIGGTFVAASVNTDS
jgi:hypothetical protein